MATRRQVIGVGLALGAANRWIVPSAAAREAPLALPPTVGGVVVDTRFAEVQQMAARVRAAGVPTLELPRDVLSLWQQQLWPAVREGQWSAIGGVTCATGAFLLRTLAADHGLRVVYEAQHEPAEGARRHHRVSGPAAVLGGLAVPSGSWQGPFVQALLQGAVTGSRRIHRTVASAATAASESQTLVSWVLAPRSRSR